jgi:transitional endoplasmic reticulum ATPase
MTASGGGDGHGVTLRVEGAEKRDAGRGIARLPERARKDLGVLSGEAIVVEGDRETVVKMWPTSEHGNFVRIDADTRANAGVTIGDTVTVRRTSIPPGERVVVRPREDLPEMDGLEGVVAQGLRDRPVSEDERVHVEGIGDLVVAETTPDGAVRVTETTTVRLVERDEAVPDPEEDPGGATYEDIGGLDDELDRVREMVELPLSEPETFRRLGIDPPKGLLLHGPPGTGKTLIARAVANEVDAYFDVISGPEVVSKYKGESEERLREAFETAAERAPAILFIDEIDSIAGRRDEEADMENRVVAQLLTLMDGLDERGQVVVIGATNRVDAIDPALRRGGRFDRELEIGVPDAKGRQEILQVHTRDMPIDDDVDVGRIAERTHGFVGADLASLATEAAMAALRRTRDDPMVTRADFERAMAAVEPSAMREYVAESVDTTFDDVGGLAEAKQVLREAVEWPLQYDRLFEATKTEPPAGVLLYGPPGTGKTLLARALAGETDVNFISVAGPELIDKYVGESEEAVRELFDRARQTAPTIVFIDELDAIAGRRGESHEVTERVVSQLLTELDGIVDTRNVMALAATNRRSAIDDALLRPGRFERHVEVPLPDSEGRRAILDVHAGDKPLADGIDMDALVAATEGFSGADLEALVREASMRAIRGVADGVDPDEANARADEVRITTDDFERALASLDDE